MTLELDEDLIGQIERNGEAAYPEEGVGALLGSLCEDGPDHDRTLAVATKIEIIPNAQQQHRERRYLVDPRDILRIERYADATGLRVLGWFHSHPDHPAAPSQTDLQFAWPGWSYVISSIARGHAHGTTSWRLSEGTGLKTFRGETILLRGGGIYAPAATEAVAAIFQAPPSGVQPEGTP